MKKLALAALIAVSFGAHATVITFEGLDPSAVAAIGAGYDGLNWNNFYTLDPQGRNDGYAAGLVSGSNVALNGYGENASFSATTSAGFSLQSGYFTGAWTAQNVTLTALFENGTTASKTFSVTTAGPSFQTFGWNDLASVTLSSSVNSQIAIDNLTINQPVPEPTEAGLLLAGLGALAVLARRRKQA